MRFALVLSCLVLGGCEVVYPGAVVGAFDVVGALEANECGAAVPATDPISFRVEVRADGARAYLRFLDPPVREGLVADDGSYRFAVASSFQVIAPDPTLGVAGCAVEQREVLVATLEPVDVPDGGVSDAGGFGDAAAPMPLALEGTSDVMFTPISGGDCTPLLSVHGGPWSTLPCGLRYVLRGTSRAQF